MYRQKSAGEEITIAAPDVLVREDGYVLRNLHLDADKKQAYRLRHLIFSEQLKWVPRAEDGLEIDAYDEVAVHFGVFDQGGKLQAYVRLLTADRTFMIEKEFLSVIGIDHPIRKERNTCELTRFCVDPEARSEVVRCDCGSFDITMLLFKGVYLWCLDHGVRFIYGVTDMVIRKFLNMKGLPYESMGKPKRMPDGVVAIAVMLDWMKFELMNSGKRPGLIRWFSQKSISFSPRATAMA